MLRLLSLLGPPAPWWGWVLVGIGLVSALAGVLLALGQSGLKRVLAYSSVENIGLVALGSGLGVIGPRIQACR
ncbi:MAG: proton-conducting transporter membrane subunit [Thermoanaerobaculaceae bacterium]